MNATSFPANKDYRAMIDIRQKPIQGRIKREIKLPPEDLLMEFLIDLRLQ